MFLASAMVLPVGLSYAENSTLTVTSPGFKTTGQVPANQTAIPLVNSSNTSVNQTMTVNATSPQNTNDTKAAQQISDFIHQAATDFKQQGMETRQAMLDCRDKLQNANPDQISNIKNVCTTNLSAIKVKYQDERNHYHDLIKQYRQSVMVFLNDARGNQMSKSIMDKEFEHLGMMMHSGGVGRATTVNNTNCVNPNGQPTGKC